MHLTNLYRIFVLNLRDLLMKMIDLSCCLCRTKSQFNHSPWVHFYLCQKPKSQSGWTVWIDLDQFHEFHMNHLDMITITHWCFQMQAQEPRIIWPVDFVPFCNTYNLLIIFIYMCFCVYFYCYFILFYLVFVGSKNIKWTFIQHFFSYERRINGKSCFLFYCYLYSVLTDKIENRREKGTQLDYWCWTKRWLQGFSNISKLWNRNKRVIVASIYSHIFSSHCITVNKNFYIHVNFLFNYVYKWMNELMKL